jgi:hypothetical protein
MYGVRTHQVRERRLQGTVGEGGTSRKGEAEHTPYLGTVQVGSWYLYLRTEYGVEYGVEYK